MSKQVRDTIVGLLAVALAVGAVYCASVGRSPKINLDTYQVLGAIAGEETGKLLAGKGSVLLLARGTGDAENPSVEAELKSCRDALKKLAGISVITEKVEASPMQMMSTGGAISPDDLFKRLEAHPGLGGVVLFMGLPPLGPSEIEALGKSGAKIVLAAPFQPALERLLQARAVHLAIVPKTDSAPEGVPAPKSIRERFDREYEIVRAPVSQ